MTTLVIVESPEKVKTVESILDGHYIVMVNVDHVHDLPSKEMGLEPPTFELSCEAAEHSCSVLAKFKTAVKGADGVTLTTDPNREEEATSWYLAETLNLKNP